MQQPPNQPPNPNDPQYQEFLKWQAQQQWQQQQGQQWQQPQMPPPPPPKRVPLWRQKVGPLPFWAWLIIILFVAGTLINLVQTGNPMVSKSSQEAALAGTATANAPTPPPVATTPPSTPRPAAPTNTAVPATAPLPPDAQIKAAVTKAFNGTGFANKKKPITVDTTYAGTLYNVKVRYEIADSFGTPAETFRLGVFNVMKETYGAALPIGDFDVEATFPVQDKYGKPLDNYTVARIILRGTQATKVSWATISRPQLEQLYEKLFLDDVIK